MAPFFTCGSMPLRTRSCLRQLPPESGNRESFSVPLEPPVAGDSHHHVQENVTDSRRYADMGAFSHRIVTHTLRHPSGKHRGRAANGPHHAVPSVVERGVGDVLSLCFAKLGRPPRSHRGGRVAVETLRQRPVWALSDHLHVGARRNRRSNADSSAGPPGRIGLNTQRGVPSETTSPGVERAVTRPLTPPAE